ncbi:MAG: metallophosphoesterase [Bacteroidota bacterium]|nr:metallophosphoesterase [Bacteroidota bacterium]
MFLSTCRFLGLSLVLSLPLCAQKPLFSFGLIADIEWADRDDSAGCYHRAVAGKLREAVHALNYEPLRFVVQLGDLIYARGDEVVHAQENMDAALSVLTKLKAPLYHVAGEHCREVGIDVLRKKWKATRLYRDFTVTGLHGWRFVILDGAEEGDGFLGRDQIAWFGKTLAQAMKKKERVIVFSHYPLIREAAPSRRLSRPDTLLAILDSLPCVAAWIAGHDHGGGYAVRNGVHHITIRALVAYPERATYSIVNVFADRIVELGCGFEPVRVCSFEPVKK